MDRKIIGFNRDETGDWVAELDCYHRQHVRNKPPLINRPWVESVEGRKEKLGAILSCVRCDRLEFPEGMGTYKRTPEFNHLTVPRGLLRNHSTREGTWGVITLISGELNYVIFDDVYRLRPGVNGVIPPIVPHRVEPPEDVRFYVEFFRLKETDRGTSADGQTQGDRD
jgi:tellurite methyltransferase